MLSEILFEQLHTIHGYSNGHYIPLVFTYLVSKSEDPRCTSFADYILENYIVPDSRFPPTLWSSLPSLNAKRTTNGAESFHAHYNEKCYAAHPTIFIRRSEMEKLSYLMDQYSELQANEIDRYQFVKAIGYK